MRIYQGLISRGDWIINTRTGKKTKLSRLVRMHANKMEVSVVSHIIIMLIGILSFVNKQHHSLAIAREKFASHQLSCSSLSKAIITIKLVGPSFQSFRTL